LTKHSIEIEDDPKLLQLVDTVRGAMTRDEFFQHCFERGFVTAVREHHPDLDHLKKPQKTPPYAR
jgi:hypothetical protein